MRDSAKTAHQMKFQVLLELALSLCCGCLLVEQPWIGEEVSMIDTSPIRQRPKVVRTENDVVYRKVSFNKLVRTTHATKLGLVFVTL